MRACVSARVGCTKNQNNTNIYFCARTHVIKRQGRRFLYLFSSFAWSHLASSPAMDFIIVLVKCLNYLNKSWDVCGCACVGSVRHVSVWTSFFLIEFKIMLIMEKFKFTPVNRKKTLKLPNFESKYLD